MSRRKAFDTGLTDSEPKSRPGPPSQPKRSQQASSKKALPPRVSPPQTSKPTAHVPTEQGEGVDPTSGPVGHPANGHPQEQQELGDDDVCIICTEPVTYWSVGICGHKTCHVCAVRLRTFYKKYECTFCKTITPSLYFSRSADLTFPTEHHVRPSPANQIAAAQAGAEKLEKGKIWYEGLTLPGKLDIEKFEYGDQRLSVVFEDEDLQEQTLLLLRFNCPSPDCDYMAANWDGLEKHTLGTHGKVICRVCRSQLSRFAHEQTLYPPHLLGLHDPSRLKRGQRPPRPKGDEIELVKTWDAPHPLCEFCNQAYFGPDELFAHMRKSHEECFVCKNQGEPHVYFQDYEKLNAHFHADHFPCMQQACLEQKFVVFPNETDLRAHLISEHGENMTARDRAQARQLSAGFLGHADARRGGGSSRHDGGSGGHSGRGFVMNNSPQAQQLQSAPIMTAEQAAQHRRQIQTDRQEESRRRRGFDTELTDSRREQASIANPNASGTRSGFATPREEVDDATAERHAALLARMTMLVNDSSVKLQSFRSAVRQYRNNESGARDMVDTIYNVLDQDVDATMGVVRELASLFEVEGDKDKRGAVLEALNGFRVEQQEQFPALHHPGGQGGEWAGITSGKILNAKRTTHTNGRRSSQAVWDRVEAAAGSAAPKPRATAGTNGRYVPGATALSSSGAFPALGGASAGPSKPATHSTPWSSGGAGSSSKAPPALTGPIIRSVNYPTPVAKAKPLNNAAFPSLPKSSGQGMTKEERAALFSKPNPRDESIRRITGAGARPPPVTNGWGGSSSSENVTAGVRDMSLGNEDASETPSAGGGKKKGKQKQLLFTVSARPS